MLVMPAMAAVILAKPPVVPVVTWIRRMFHVCQANNDQCQSVTVVMTMMENLGKQHSNYLFSFILLQAASVILLD